jgi:hypothetical protein
VQSRTHGPARSCARRVPRRALLAGSFFFFLATGAARADDQPAATALDVSACSEGSRARLQWLINRLEEREQYADIWWKGWFGFYAIGVVYQSTSAALEDDGSHQADDIVGAVKALVGVTRLYFARPTARLGADPLIVAAPPDEAACAARVAEGEALLQKAAKESDRRWDWRPHAFNVALNVVGAVIATQAFDDDDGFKKGWYSMGLGIAVGEAMIFSHPWKGRSDLDEYQAAFSPSTPQTSWSIQPYHAGLRLQVNF